MHRARRRINSRWALDSFSHAFPIKITNTANRLETQGTATHGGQGPTERAQECVKKGPSLSIDSRMSQG